MSAKIIGAFEAEAQRLDAEADNMGTGKADAADREMRHVLASTLRRLAQRSQGLGPAAVAAGDYAAADQGNPPGGGLAVEKTDSETGEPV